MKKPESDNINSGIIKSITVCVLFLLLVFSVVASLLLYNTKGELVGLFKGSINLRPRFYFWTLVVILLSSLVYTPISYGISNYFVKKPLKQSFSRSVLFLFKKPKLLIKAVLINATLRVITGLWRLLILFAGALSECVIFVLFVVVSGENIFDYEQNFFESVVSFFTTNEFFVFITVLLQLCTLWLFLYIKIRYIMCKYVFLCFETVGIFEAIRIGKYVISKNVLRTMLFYVKYISECILVVASFGSYKKTYKDSFSYYAKSVVLSEIDAYFCERIC